MLIGVPSQKTTGLRLYNTLTKQEEDVVLERGKRITMYTCGPTVYGRPHIGNYSSFLMADFLRRWLEVQGYEVLHVKNITDVGHLVRDSDEGEDKLEQQAKQEHGSVTHDSVIAIARKYEELYLEDEQALAMLEPYARPRASEYVDEMKEMITALLTKGVAYVTDDGIYFDVTTFPQYGELSGNTLEHLAAGARVEVNEHKHHPADFALWKFCVGPNAHHALRWPSPSAKATDGKSVSAMPEGFPGWHIECSAMSRALLGDTIDIHTGGEDNIFPHHECEIAQSECVINSAHGTSADKQSYKPFVRYWLHKRRIDLEGEKMSKSLGNVLLIPDIVARGYHPLDIRYYLLSVHYRTNLKFSWKGMDDAKKARQKIVEWMAEVEAATAEGDCSNTQHESLAALYADFRNALNADLNASAALASVFELMTWYRSHKSICADTHADLLMVIAFIRHTFGCFEQSEQAIAPAALALAQQRDEARARKDFAASDALRAQLEALGYEVRDTKEGTQLRMGSK